MKTFIDKLSLYAIAFFGVFIMFPSEKRGYLVGFIALGALLSLIEFRKFRVTKLLLVNTSLYLLYALSLMWSFDKDISPKRLETAMSLLIFPVIFSIFYYNQSHLFSQKTRLICGKVFIISGGLFATIIFGYFAYLGFFTGHASYGFCLSKLTRKLPILADHPIYISLIFGVTILWASELYKDTTKKTRIFLLVLSTLTVIAMFFLSRRGPIIALFIALLFFVKLIKFSFGKTLFFSGLILFFFSLIFLVKPIKTRVFDVLNKETYQVKDETNSINNRIQIYDCAYQLFLQKPWLGHGVGNDQNELYDCYKKNLYYLYEKKFNTHNQYLSILIKTGVLGGLVFLYFLFFNFKMAFVRKDKLFLSIITFFVINFLFENILERQNGVILFAFLINYFGFYNYKTINDK